MEVTDPNTGLGVTVRMRRDLPGYQVSRARRSPRLRWSLPVDIQWQSECVIKFLGQSCACCDKLSAAGLAPASERVARAPSPTEGKSSEKASVRQGGHATVYVESQSMRPQGSAAAGKRNVSTAMSTTFDRNLTRNVTQDAVKSDKVSNINSPTTSPSGVPSRVDALRPPLASKRSTARRRKQLISPGEMLMSEQRERMPSDDVPSQQTTIDSVHNNDSAEDAACGISAQQPEVKTLAPLADIAELAEDDET